MTPIALATYRKGSSLLPALVINSQLYDLAAALGAGLPAPKPAWIADGIASVVANWPDAAPWVREVANRAGELVAAHKVASVPNGTALVAAPIRPERIFCAASNYVEHANEMGTVLASKSESKPYMFLKLRNTVIGPNETIRMPPETKQLDWEVELAAVIGRDAGASAWSARSTSSPATPSSTTSPRATSTCAATIRSSSTGSKASATTRSRRFGPWIVPASQIPDPQAVAPAPRRQRHADAGRFHGQHDLDGARADRLPLDHRHARARRCRSPPARPTGVGMGRGIFLKDGDAPHARPIRGHRLARQRRRRRTPGLTTAVHPRKHHASHRIRSRAASSRRSQACSLPARRVSQPRRR